MVDNFYNFGSFKRGIDNNQGILPEYTYLLLIATHPTFIRHLADISTGSNIDLFKFKNNYGEGEIFGIGVGLSKF